MVGSGVGAALPEETPAAPLDEAGPGVTVWAALGDDVDGAPDHGSSQPGADPNAGAATVTEFGFQVNVYEPETGCPSADAACQTTS